MRSSSKNYNLRTRSTKTVNQFDYIGIRDQDGLEARKVNENIGVFATKEFLKDDFLLEYRGEILSEDEASLMEEKYNEQDNSLCYMYFFSWKGKTLCIDASTKFSSSLGRLVNDGPSSKVNCKMKIINHNGPCLCLFATKDIHENEELFYDYGKTKHRSKISTNESLKDNEYQRPESTLVVKAVNQDSDNDDHENEKSVDTLITENDSDDKDEDWKPMKSDVDQTKDRTTQDSDSDDQIDGKSVDTLILENDSDNQDEERWKPIESDVDQKYDRTLVNAVTQNSDNDDQVDEKSIGTFSPESDSDDQGEDWKPMDDVSLDSDSDDQDGKLIKSTEDQRKHRTPANAVNQDSDNDSQDESDSDDQDGKLIKSTEDQRKHRTPANAVNQDSDNDSQDESDSDDQDGKLIKSTEDQRKHRTPANAVNQDSDNDSQDESDSDDQDGKLIKSTEDQRKHRTPANAVNQDSDNDSQDESDSDDQDGKLIKSTEDQRKHRTPANAVNQDSDNDSQDESDSDDQDGKLIKSTEDQRKHRTPANAVNQDSDNDSQDESDSDDQDGKLIKSTEDQRKHRTPANAVNQDSDNDSQDESDSDDQDGKLIKSTEDQRKHRTPANAVNQDSDNDSQDESDSDDQDGKLIKSTEDQRKHRTPANAVNQDSDNDSQDESDSDDQDDEKSIDKIIPESNSDDQDEDWKPMDELSLDSDSDDQDEHGKPFHAGVDCGKSDDKSYQEEEIHINFSRKMKTREGEKRIYDKRNACLYCGKLLLVVIGRHYLSMHADRPDVARILALPPRSKERSKALTLLRHRGNYHHNDKVRQTKCGELILLRRPTSDQLCSFDDYGPCPECLAYVQKGNLWHHVRYRCIAKDSTDHSKEKKKRKCLQMESDILMNLYEGATDKLRHKVLACMKRDNIFKILSSDPLILEYGNQILKKQSQRKHLVSQKMRSVALLVQQLRELDCNGTYISDFLKPSKFDVVVMAVEMRSGPIENSEIDEFECPSVAIKYGHDLTWLARIKRSQAIRKNDDHAEEEANRYLQLHQAEWTTKVSSGASASLNARKCMKVVELPKTSDLKKLSKYLKTSIDQLLISKLDFRSYRRLQKLTLARLILFNKRRPKEMSKITIETITNTPDWAKCGIEELSDRLSSLEKQLSKDYQLVKTIGKRGRPVPVIIPPECSKALNILINKPTRDSVGVPACNRFVFARNTSGTFLDGGECIAEIVTEVDLESPSSIKSTRVRQYAATVSQVLSLGSNEIEWLADHLGHDVNIHKQYYRLQESTVELCKVSKLLLAMDRGEVGKWTGKSLNDIHIDDIPLFEGEDDETPNDELCCADGGVNGDGNKQAEPKSTNMVNSINSIRIDNSKVDKKRKKEAGAKSTKMVKSANGGVDGDRNKQAEPKSTNMVNSINNVQVNHGRVDGVKNKQAATKSLKSTKKKFFRKPSIKTPWTVEEKRCVYSVFSENIRDGIIPSRDSCRKAHRDHQCLQRREPEHIKNFVRNEIVRRARVV